jgi:L-arabinokinase
VIVFYSSSHGLGHISRDLAVVGAILARAPHTRIALRTSAPRWFIDTSLGPDARVEVMPGDVDTGVVQIDSLSIDEDETARAAARFHAGFPDRVVEEADVIRRIGASLVVGDAPALAFAAAHQAGVPSVMLANFTWDWIYEAYPRFDRLAPGVIDTIRAAYARATHTLRLPLWGGFAAVPHPRDIPLIARRSRLGRDTARNRLEVDTDHPIVLVSFGRYGLTLPLARVAAEEDLTVIVSTDGSEAAEVPDYGRRARGQLLRVSAADLARRDLRYEDLVAAADVVVSKPGYGIISECAANETALLYAARGSFIEQDLLVREMPRVVRCQPLAHDRLLAGGWRADINAILAKPRPAVVPDTSGAEVAAEAILRLYT